MTAQPSPSPRPLLATAAAVASVALALGVTAAALLGYIRPPGEDPAASPSALPAEAGPPPAAAPPTNRQIFVAPPRPSVRPSTSARPQVGRCASR